MTADWSRSRPRPSARRCRARISTTCWASRALGSGSRAPCRTRRSARRPAGPLGPWDRGAARSAGRGGRRDRVVRLVLSPRNPHKVRELGALMEPHEILALPDDVELPPETGTTFAENALTKARAAAAAA